MRLLTNKIKWNDVTFREMVAAKLLGGCDTIRPSQAVELADSLIAHLNKTAQAAEAAPEPPECAQ